MSEKRDILEMLKEGTITVDEATKLLDAINNPKEELSEKPYNKRMFRIRVDSKEGDKVNVNIPVSLAKVALSTKGSYTVNGENILKNIDIDQLIDLIDHEACGDIVTVDSADGDTVRIYID